MPQMLYTFFVVMIISPKNFAQIIRKAAARTTEPSRANGSDLYQI
jgi:hypothetical protein